MRNILYSELREERCNAAALRMANAAAEVLASQSEELKIERAINIRDTFLFPEEFEKLSLNSKRENSTKIAYRVIINELNSLKKAKSKL